MARPTKRRRICELPRTSEFIPSGKECGAAVELTVDEYETIRLIDRLGYSQEECARQMNVARTTIQAIYDAARGKLAEAIVEGKRLVISGGAYDVCPNAHKCCGKDCARRRCGDKRCENGELTCRRERGECGKTDK